MDESPLENRRAALIVAHPGHELRVHGWMERAQPTVFVLSDGSGHEGRPRMESSVRLIENTGSKLGSVFGRWPDRTIYRALLEKNFAEFQLAVHELADALRQEEIDYVVCEAMEGHCSTHDVCRLLTAAAVRDAQEKTGREIECYEFLLLAPHASRPGETDALRVTLDDAALARKIAAARAYPELATEVEIALIAVGIESFREEILRPFSPLGETPSWTAAPFYERHGERVVDAGRYEKAIRYREHFLPLAEALSRPTEAASKRRAPSG